MLPLYLIRCYKHQRSGCHGTRARNKRTVPTRYNTPNNKNPNPVINCGHKKHKKKHKNTKTQKSQTIASTVVLRAPLLVLQHCTAATTTTATTTITSRERQRRQQTTTPPQRWQQRSFSMVYPTDFSIVKAKAHVATGNKCHFLQNRKEKN